MNNERTAAGRVRGAMLLLAATLAACDYGEKLYAPPSQPVSVSVEFCAQLAPTWVAYQDGDAAWSRALPDLSGAHIAFRHDFVSDHAAVATLTPFGGTLTFLNIFFGAPEELASIGDTIAFDCIGSIGKTLFGSVSGLPPDAFATVSSGLSLRAFVPQGQTTFKLIGLADGPQDLLATRVDQVNGAPAVTRLIVRRNINLADSATIPALDFNSAEAFDAVTSQLSIPGLNGGNASVGSFLHSSNSEMILAIVNQPGVATPHYFSLPAARLSPTELQVLRINSTGPGPEIRAATLYYREPTDRAVPLGAALIEPTIAAVATSPSLRLRASFVAQSEYDRLTSFFLQQGPAPVLINLSMTPKYAARSGRGIVLELPDLSSVSGFDPAWTLVPGSQVLWSATRIGGTLGTGRSPVPTDGATQLSVFRGGTFSP